MYLTLFGIPPIQKSPRDACIVEDIAYDSERSTGMRKRPIRGIFRSIIG